MNNEKPNVEMNEAGLNPDTVNNLISDIFSLAENNHATFLEMLQALIISKCTLEAWLANNMQDANDILERMKQHDKEREEQIVKDLRDVFGKDKLERDLQIVDQAEQAKPSRQGFKKKSSRQNLRQAK